MERKVDVAVIVWLIMYCLGDADTATAMATEDGEGGWKTVEAPWEDSDRDYTYEEVCHLFTSVVLIIALY